ncbi:MAG: UDP-N-acetylglucosamine 2-epimerase (hydrolyzing) [Deltaproteobacteria bacterium]|nr:UDP-N-acetylglucosamine 2-epimerase (hydrolyzing) [Deltaproteobacteria bacterium]MBW1924264.1 UDP-N-acetylglucosamine 2-epimerase (hydrolyzing) [Deltaproteobacteria bacterium]MBW2008856.1 UDP-N-acetylglucosamine 2-epimerase (hydrolyzing) [Deltaproteobacteria bacterium]
MKRKIAIFTGNRAEYGLQYPIIKAISEHPSLEYYLLASGAHLDEDFGYTVKEIEKDGFRVYREVRLTMEQDNLFATAQAIGTGILSMSEILAELKPHFLVVYADRFEGFAAAVAGTQMGIPTAHIEGGDLTEGGALDDSVRHAITKLSHLHFTTNQEAYERIRKMGEEEWRIHKVGFPALDLIARGEYASPEEIKERYGIDPDRPIVLFTQHSVSTEYDKARDQIRPSLEALSGLAREGVQVIITYPNNDAGGKQIIVEIEKARPRLPEGVQVHKSLGRYNYHGVLNICGTRGPGVCAGNSSSGIKETPAFGCPVVDIGSRQRGRLRAENVLNVGYDAGEIGTALRRALFDGEFREKCRTCENPYGRGDAGMQIARKLASIPIDVNLIQKKMTY